MWPQSWDFNEEKSLVGVEGEEHCSQEEQQHTQVTRADSSYLGLCGAQVRGQGAEEAVVGRGQAGARLWGLMCYA